MKIKQISAREILDSRGMPTVECCVELKNGLRSTASVPSGASVGKYEAVELRDGDTARYLGKGVLTAIKNIETRIAPALCAKNADVELCDKIMLDLDGDVIHKSNLGANAILAVSIAVARAQAMVEGLDLFLLVQKISGAKKIGLPSIMCNVINGGAHADNGLDFQEFMIMPSGTESYSQALERVVLVYQALKKLLKDTGYSTGVGDEGGFAPYFKKSRQPSECEALNFLMKAVEGAGFTPGKDILFCLDVAASQFFDKKESLYHVRGEKIPAQGLVEIYQELIADYPIYSIEDGLDEEDLDGWRLLTKDVGSKIMLVGDDVFVSNSVRIQDGIDCGVANAALIKPNQVGTVSETLAAINICSKNKYRTVVSHRSGETTDTFISDLVVGCDSGYFKAGAPARGERTAKYNRLLEIERLLKSH